MADVISVNIAGELLELVHLYNWIAHPTRRTSQLHFESSERFICLDTQDDIEKQTTRH